MISGKLGEVMERPFLSWENYRLWFDVVFWLMLAITYVGYAIVLVEDQAELASRYDMRLFGLLPVTLAFAAVVVSWHLLPWDRGAKGRRLLAIPLFLACLFWANYAMVSLDRAFYWPFFLLAFAHGVFAFGPRKSVLYAACVMGLILVYLVLTDEAGLLADALLIVALFPSVFFVIAACAAILEATRRRAEAQDLLAELEVANARLEDYAATVRELSISEERTRMAREMHDSVGHYLAVVNVQLQAAEKLLQKSPRDAREQLERAKASSSAALSEVRRSVRALKPLAVTERSGAGALAVLAEGFEGTRPAVSFEVVGEERALPSGVELVLYRALQEGLTNALKHSGAHRVLARLSFEPRSVVLNVADDGQGAPEKFFEDGFGLRSLEERARSLGGVVEAGNVAGGGFGLEVRLPTGGTA